MLLPASDKAPRIARDFVRRQLAADLDPAILDDVVLMASEIVTNAIEHGKPPINLEVRPDGERVRISVVDCAPGLPEPREMPEPVDSLSGRGMAIVNSLAIRWGTDYLSLGGKDVWFEVLKGRPQSR